MESMLATPAWTRIVRSARLDTDGPLAYSQPARSPSACFYSEEAEAVGLAGAVRQK